MPIKLYYLPFSPPARAVNLTVHALCLKVEYIIIRTLNNEHLTPEYLKVIKLYLNVCFNVISEKHTCKKLQ